MGILMWQDTDSYVWQNTDDFIWHDYLATLIYICAVIHAHAPSMSFGSVYPECTFRRVSPSMLFEKVELPDASFTNVYPGMSFATISLPSYGFEVAKPSMSFETVVLPSGSYSVKRPSMEFEILQPGCNFTAVSPSMSLKMESCNG